MRDLASERRVDDPVDPRAARIRGPLPDAYLEILSAEAVGFVADLVRRFRPRRDALLALRRETQTRLDAGERPAFLPGTRSVREAEWRVAPIPGDLLDRRVEITGPVDAKMIVNALNSGANVFMADFEDATAPTWENVIEGQIHLRNAVAGTLRFVEPQTGKVYVPAARTATLMVRPRGWHLPESHFVVDGIPAPAALFDFGIFFFHNARQLLARGSGPYFYLPKLQNHLEARLWNDVFDHAERALAITAGSIRATVLIETLPAAFEMDEILYELRTHSAGLNCGRWDYIFSFIKTLRSDPGATLPDRSQVTMEQPFLRAYTQLLVRTCHRRDIHAIGGMAAQIPIRKDTAASLAALEKVRADKLREVRDGHDGTWVAHPGLVPVAREVFDAHMKPPHQIARRREEFTASAGDLLRIPEGTRTEVGLRHNVRVGVQYLEAWLGGSGCVPLYNLMEDAATAEICRTQIWQWVRHGARLEDGRRVTGELVQRVLDEEIDALEGALDPESRVPRRFGIARRLFETVALTESFEEFLTLPAYEHLTASRTKS